MTGTESRVLSTGTDSQLIDPGLAIGRSRLVLFVGMVGYGLGTFVSSMPVVLAGVVLVCLAFGLNTVGKLVHYHGLSIPGRERVLLGLSWVLLAATMVALVAHVAHARYSPGGAEYAPPLGVTALGFAAVHKLTQKLYTPETADANGE